MDKKEIFISYRSTESAHAYFMKDFLETNGFSVWMAPESIPVGSDYATEIPIAIKNCTAVVLVLSKKAQRSKWVRKEINSAFDLGKAVMPFMVENCKLTKEFNFYLSNVQRYEAYKDKTMVLYNMLVKLCDVAGKNPPEKPVFPTEADRDDSNTIVNDSELDSFLIRLTPYGRKSAKDKKVRPLLHTATVVIAAHAFPAIGSVLSVITIAPLLIPFLIIAFFAAWYLSYGVCLRMAVRIKSSILGVVVTGMLTVAILTMVILAMAAASAVFMG